GDGREDRLVSAVDHKPKTTTRLQRLEDIRRHPEVAVLVDHYDDDWSQLWWVRLRGRAHVVESGAEHDEVIEALRARYRPSAEGPPTGPGSVAEPPRWGGWGW